MSLFYDLGCHLSPAGIFSLKGIFGKIGIFFNFILEKKIIIIIFF